MYQRRCLQFPPRLPFQSRWRTMERTSSKGRSPRGNSPCGKKRQNPRKDNLNGTETTPSCDSWCPPPVFQNCTTHAGCKFGEKWSFPHQEAERQLEIELTWVEGRETVGHCISGFCAVGSTSVLRKGPRYVLKNSGKKRTITRGDSTLVSSGTHFFFAPKFVNQT